MICWTKDYDSYLKWSLYHVFDFIDFIGMESEEELESEEVDSVMFTYWYCEVKK